MTPGTRHVGAADVEAIEQATAEYQRWEYTYGGGMARDAIIAQLRSVLPLLKAQVAAEVRPRLHVATAYLALLAAWTSFDVQLHDTARQLWMIGLNVTRNADDPQGADSSPTYSRTWRSRRCIWVALTKRST